MVRVSCNVLLLPVCTVPKLRLEVLMLRAPGACPDPESGTLSGDPGALLVITSVPSASPDDLGLKTTLRGALFPAARDSGRETPLTE